MRKISLTLALVALSGLAAAAEAGSVGADNAWRMLSEGNERFATGLALKPHSDPVRRHQLARGQEPFAVVLGCSDSRVTPEIVFDQGLGDLFVVRSAGNAADDINGIGSVEYAVDHLGAKLIVILGHEDCGAVTAAVEGMKKDDEVSVDELVARLKPAADEARDRVGGLKGQALVAEAVERNVLFQMRNLLKGSPHLAKLVGQNKVKLIGGVYSLDSGRVRWLGGHPSEKAILQGKKP